MTKRGKLIGVPFQRGLGGKGGVSKEFKREDHPARALRVESLHGLLFATFSADVEPLDAYLGERMVKHLASVINGRRIRILGLSAPDCPRQLEALRGEPA